MLVRQTNADRPGFAEEHAELILALAERYLPEPTSDFMAAYRGIKAALLEYDRMRAEPALPANTGDQINALLERLDALNNTGSFDDGAKLLATAREAARDRIDRETSELLRLLDRTVLQSRFRNKPDEAAAALVEKLRLNTPPSLFKALRGLWDEWYIRGRDGGMNFEAEVAIHLAQAILSNATGPDQRGTALNVLGNALRALGQREAGTARLEQAVEAYRAALTERTQDRVPLQWAITQMNLGTALLFLGRREAGTARLEEAVAAYRAALTEFKQDRVPLDWATTQMNLGNALSTLGEREEGTALLEQAVDAFRAALTELTQNRVPLEWAATQNSLGLVLSQLGVREGGTERLEEAVEAFHAALTEYRQDRVPLDWARTQMNLGNALAALGEFEEGTALLEQTVEAYRAGLTEVTQDRVPLDWATAQNNLGIVLGWLGEREEGTERLEEAVVAYRAALEEVTRDRAPMDWARTLANEGMTLLTLADRTDDPARARQALDQLTLAEATLRSGGHIPWADNCARQIPAAQALVDRLSAGQP
ncbi:MAG: tetratricopeptide repeat protein [Rhodobacter sp.]|nr:tetratricopeptide repeat protein [Rhodobacter sp.]